MRLLNAHTYKLQTFYRDPPPYAILSHTWGNDWDEVQFADIEDLDRAKQIHGFEKISGCANIARKQDIEWIWIDTCSINKQDAVELSEAIISMHKWYRNARICLAYLSDVSTETQLAQARWFTRGWTLQELLAPTDVHFYSRTWKFMGSRNENSQVITNITTIPPSILLESAPQLSHTAAQTTYSPLYVPSHDPLHGTSPSPSSALAPRRSSSPPPSFRRRLLDKAVESPTMLALMAYGLTASSVIAPLVTLGSSRRTSEHLEPPSEPPLDRTDLIFQWASLRHVKREEDEIYCLLGLLDVSMPVLYGEGLMKARRRLLREVRENEGRLMLGSY